MKCFDVVQTVLDATYEEVPGGEKKRDASIAAALEAMSERYRNDLMTDGGPDFGDPKTRFGYVFKYVPAHAHWLYELLRDSAEATKIMKRGKARITCLGGGPGSDLVGVLKYLDESEIQCSLFCEIVDGCEHWKKTWSDLAYLLDLKGSLHTDYVIQDVADDETWDSPSNIAKADIITLNFFVSEIFHLENCERYLATMLGEAKSGAIVLMNDNRTKKVYQLVDHIATKCGFKTLEASEGVRKIYDWGENVASLKKYQKKFGMDSKLTGHMCWRVYQMN